MRFAFRFPAVVLLFFAIIGIVVGRSLEINPVGPAVLFVAAVVFLMLALSRLSQKYFIWFLGLTVLSGAGLVANLSYQSRPQDDVARYLDSNEEFRFFGSIDSWPVIKRHKTLVTVRLDSIVSRDSISTVSGNILLDIRRETTHFAYGDRISFEGRLCRPPGAYYPGQFDYQKYLAHKGIRGIVYVAAPAYVFIDQSDFNWFGVAVNKSRQWILNCFNQNLRPLPAALASGFLIGETRDIPEEVYRAFRDTGTLHLLAVSGSNVVLVLLVFSFLLNRMQVKRTLRLILFLMVIIFFCNLSYNQPSVIRASVMALLVLLGRYFYRRVNLNNIIASAALLLVLFDPGQLFDIGFQLSFAVAWSLIIFLPYFNKFLENRRMGRTGRYVALLIFSSVIASLVSAPITVYYFGRISLITVISNLAIVPLVSLAVVGIVVLIIVFMVWPAIAVIPGMVLDRVLTLTEYLVRWFAGGDLATARVSSLSGIVTLLWLIGVMLLLASIMSRPVRRLLLFYLLIAIILVSGKSLIKNGKSFDIEVVNNPGIQAIVYPSAGIAIYRNHSNSNFDDFSGNFLPYLKANDYLSEVTQFVFLEQSYNEWERLEQFIANDMDLRAASVNGFNGLTELNTPCLYQSAIQGKGGGTLRGGQIVLEPGTVTIYMPDSTTLIVSDNPKSLILPEEAKRAQKLYVLVIADNDAQLLAGLEKVSGGNGRVILDNPDIKYNVLINNQLSSDKQDLIVPCKASNRLNIPPATTISSAVRN